MKKRIKEIFIFIFIFIFVTIIGIQTHELAHYCTANILEFKPVLHHSSITFNVKPKNNLEYKKNEFLIVLAGPLQTLLTSIIGLLIIIYRKLKGFKTINWIAVFMSFFSLRQIFNLLVSIINSLQNNELKYGGDELKISNYLNIYPGTISIITALLGLIICSYTFFCYIPKKQRLNILIAGLIGSITSFLFWTKFLGKLLLP